jgi:hypothetical protein
MIDLKREGPSGCTATLGATLVRAFTIAAASAAAITGGTANATATLDQHRMARHKAGRRSTSSR